MFGKAKPFQPGHGKQHGIGLAFAELAKPGPHIAAYGNDPKVGAKAQGLGLTAKGRRGQRRPIGQFRKGRVARGNESVARVLTRKAAGNDKAIGQPCRHILHRVNGKVDGACQQGLFDFFGEKPLPPHIGKGAIENFVAGRSDNLDFDCAGRGKGGIGRYQPVAHFCRLGTSKVAAPRADTNGRLCSHPMCVVLADPQGKVVITEDPYGASAADDGVGMIVLGLESSCDETAAAIVNDQRQILAERVYSQIAAHEPYGGIVPEIAARAHLDRLDGLVVEVMAEARIDFQDLDGVAATGGPGLVGGLLVGVMTAKAIALVHRLPFLAINHLEGHALSLRLTQDMPFPYLLLLVSGGHSQFLIVEGVGRYVQLGTTIDDAVGEAFDKTAKLLGLPYPGGPQIEKAAKTGDATRFALPRPMRGREGCDLSLSGLKTAVRQTVSRLGEDAKKPDVVADVAASFQAAVGDVLVERARNAISLFQARHPTGDAFVVAGGVAANSYLRERLGELASSERLRLCVPPPQLCTDNGTMIAWAGVERLQLGHVDDFSFAPKPRWPLDPDAAPRKHRP